MKFKNLALALAFIAFYLMICRIDKLEKRVKVLEGKVKPTVEIIVERTFNGDTGRFGYELAGVLKEMKKSQKSMTIAR